MLSRSERLAIERRRVELEDLCFGMFVCELDRPWIDTPFALQGLMLRRDTEIAALRRHCRYVYIDLNRCTAEARDAYRKAMRRRGGRAAQKAAEKGLLAGLFARLRAGLRRSPPGHETAEDPERVALAARLLLPAGLRLQAYAAPIPVEEAMPRARAAVDRGADALDALMRSLSRNVMPDFGAIDDAAAALVESVIENPDAAMLVSRMRSEHRSTYEHGLKCALNLLALGRHLGFPKEELVHLAMIGMLADIGKTRIPRDILDKPGLLTTQEYDTVKTHVALGLETLHKGLALDPKVAQGIAEHHERMDGSGYPAGLTGERISIYGRMAGIADCFAALVTERPHAAALSPQDALLRMYEWSRTLLHEALLEQLVQAIGVFPVGSLVELSTGEVALVTEQNRIRRLEPRVLIVAGPDKTALDAPIERDLMMRHDDGMPPARIARGLSAGAYGLRLEQFYAVSD